MRSLWLVAGLLGLFPLGACSGAEELPASALGAPLASVRAWPRSEVERDLVLSLQPSSGEPLRQGVYPELKVTLDNHSRDRTYTVVNANDGSEVGWREPHAWFELALRGPGEAFHAPPEVEYMRCGNYAEEWQRDLVALRPGQKLELAWTPFYFRPELDGASEVQIIAHYSYGEIARDLSKIPVPLHVMPAYAIQSAPLVLPIERPLALQVELHRPLPRGPGQPLASAISVTVKNVSTQAVELASGVDPSVLSLELYDPQSPPGVDSVMLNDPSLIGRDLAPLFPGQTRSLLNAGATTPADWSPDFTQRPRVRAVLRIDWHGKGFFRTTSPWVDAVP